MERFEAAQYFSKEEKITEGEKEKSPGKIKEEKVLELVEKIKETLKK